MITGDHSDRRSAKRGNAAGIRQDVGQIPEGTILAGMVVNGVSRRRRIFDAQIVFEITSRGEIIEIVVPAVDATAGFEGSTTTAIEAQIAAIFEGSGLRL